MCILIHSGHLCARLSNGVEMPAIGFGTWKLEGEDRLIAQRSAKYLKHSESSGSTGVLEVVLTDA